MECFVCMCLVVTLGSMSFTGASDCPDLWIPYHGSCYLFGHQSLSFFEAEHYCQTHSSRLVHLETRDESSFIKDHITYAAEKRWWIGLTDDAVEGVWVWNGSGERPEFTDWTVGEPNGGHIESCAEIVQYSPTSLHWNDIPCSGPRQMICEKPTGNTELIVG